MQVIGFDNDLRETRLDREAMEFYVGAPNLAIYGEQFFGLVELEEVTIKWEQIAAVAFLLDCGAGYWNYDTWNAANNNDWKMVYIAQFVAGGFGLTALLASAVVGGNLLLNYSLLHMGFELGILALTVLAEGNTANVTNEATTLSYVASVFGFLATLAANVWHRFF